ncbi:MAG: FeoB-associated Cys-rich membrane protein [Deltaproteobacteria bacterium]|uniref:FeoB-associated Cys-rich membrane protein n=1 Tax=Candidatus Zymogenus saltonus TaxID=2844893 RepID=A0A9D8KDZ7_9DELT|nr:FeoB-associated Cys-rich membrane protein [Candidatus Zymogenus saltonus]
MWDIIIVFSVVLLASFYIIRRIVKALSLKDGASGCGSCPMSGNCAMYVKGEGCEKK